MAQDDASPVKRQDPNQATAGEVPTFSLTNDDNTASTG